MTRQGKSVLRFALPLFLLAAVYLSAPGVIFHSANAQCSRLGFKLNYGHFSTGANKSAMADFNADGKMDIATSSDSNTIAVYFGNGLGEFGAPAVYMVANGFNILAAEMNNDARPDIVLISRGSLTNVSTFVLFNNGSGGFGAPVANTYLLDLFSLQIADINGDGKGDLVSRNHICCSGVLVRFGNGLGHFPTEVTYPLASALGFVVGDFNGDSKQDLAAISGNFALRKVTLFLNDGVGGLVAGTETDLGDGSSISVARDFNNDGKSDIAGYNQGQSIALMLLNNGNGSFTRTNYSVPSSVTGVRDGDFNGDGNVDLIACAFVSSLQPANSSTLYGNGTGSLTLGERFDASDWINTGTVADFNNDGKSDLVIATGSGLSTAGTGVRVFLRTCNDVGNTKRADYDGDGATDFAVWRPSNGNWIIKQSSNNQVRMQQWGGGAFGDVPVPGDYDGDNKSDLAVFRALAGIWYVLRSSDSSAFGIQWGASGDKPVPGDYDGDGKTDFAVWRPSNGAWYILRSSDNTVVAFAFGTNGDKPAQADFDNDDKTDVAVFRPSNGYWYLLRSSDNAFIAVQFGINGDFPIPADYDGDGKADIAIYRRGSAFYFLNSWNNSVTGQGDFNYLGTPSAADLPAPVKRADNFGTFIWRPASGYFGGFVNTSSGTIGTSGDIPVAAPYVIE